MHFDQVTVNGVNSNRCRKHSGRIVGKHCMKQFTGIIVKITEGKNGKDQSNKEK